MLIVEGHLAIPYRARIADCTKEEFDKLSTEEQRLLVQDRGAIFEHGGIQYCASVLDSYDEEPRTS